ncbi:MAG: acyltransferase family protein [Aureliella sp.]|jgi:surface polysaccharide O-acyltransferase-like enzyme
MRNATLDWLKIVLACFVVGIHAEALSDRSPLASYLLTEGLFRIAVPLFLIINGYYLRQHLEAGKPFWLWFKRVLLLYVLWTIIYAPYILSAARGSGSLAGLKVAKDLVLGYYHLWYLPAMLVAGTATWLVGRCCARALLPLATIVLMGGLALQYATNYSWILDPDAPHWLYRNGVFVGFPFFAIGAALGQHEPGLARRWSTASNRIAAAAALTLVLAEAMVNYHACGHEFDILLSLAVACPVVFVIANGQCTLGSTKLLASLSTAIYLVHPLLLAGLAQLGLEDRGTLLFVLTGVSAIAVGMLLVVVSRRTRPLSFV